MTAFSGFNGMTEAELKQFWAYLFSPAGGTATTGVVSGLAVAQTTTASGSVTIASGAGVVQDAVLSGVSPVVNNSTVTLDVLTGSPMSGVSNPRNDIVVFNPAAEAIQVVVGTPNAAPTDPTVAATLLKLARLRHAANATTIPTAKIDDLRVFTGLRPFAADTGWKDIPLSAGGFTAPDVRWQARMLDGVVYFRGGLQNATFVSNVTYTTVGTLPAGITAPVTVTSLALATNTTTKSALIVTPAGDVQMYAAGGTASFYIISGSYAVG